jgi:hypothetical protein
MKIDDEQIKYIFDKKSRQLVDLLPSKFVLLFYPDITRQINNIVSTLNEDKLKQIFPEKVNLITPINTEIIITLTQITNNHLGNMFITKPFINMNDVKNTNIYPLKKSDYNAYLSKIGQPITEEQIVVLLKLLTDDQIKTLLSTLLLYQKKNIVSLLSDKQLKSLSDIEKYGIF